jgi:hypothetical protein
MRCERCRRWKADFPILEDATWKRLSGKDGHQLDHPLCWKCMVVQAKERGIFLSVEDLRPCPYNLFHSPRSWFDLFMSTEPKLPENLSEWYAAMELLEMRGGKSLH